jgi:subtilisin family serine protease
MPAQWKWISQEDPFTFSGPAVSRQLPVGLVQGPGGNSFSGPHVAGVAALMLSANPELNPWDIKRILETTARDLGEPGWDPIHGHGLVDALAAVRACR